jgi:hypothetical protein
MLPNQVHDRAPEIGGNGRLIAEEAETPDQANKGLLRHVFRQVGVACQKKGQAPGTGGEKGIELG